MRLRDYSPRLIRSSELRRLREIEEEWNEEHPPHDPEAYARFVEQIERGRWAIESRTVGAKGWAEAVRAKAGDHPVA